MCARARSIRAIVRGALGAEPRELLVVELLEERAVEVAVGGHRWSQPTRGPRLFPADPPHQPTGHALAVAGVGVEDVPDLHEPGPLIRALGPLVRELGGEGHVGCAVLGGEVRADQLDGARPRCRCRSGRARRRGCRSPTNRGPGRSDVGDLVGEVEPIGRTGGSRRVGPSSSMMQPRALAVRVGPRRGSPWRSRRRRESARRDSTTRPRAAGRASAPSTRSRRARRGAAGS